MARRRAGEDRGLMHRERFDPAMLGAGLVSAVVHAVVIGAILFLPTVDWRDRDEATAYVVGLVDVAAGSPALEIGPLAGSVLPAKAAKVATPERKPVSYTHLTLPTICSV